MPAPRTQVAVQPAEYVSPRPAAPPTQLSGTAVLLAQCLHSAIDAVIGAEMFAASKGRQLSFASEDVRAMALNIYIGEQRQGGR
jgi:hypothetical protein